MTQQTNALRLADALASQWNQLDPVDPFRADVGAASEELRRLDALSAGDAVDAQRYRWLMDNCTLGIKQNGVGWSLNTSDCVAPDCIKDVGDAIDAAMRKAIP